MMAASAHSTLALLLILSGITELSQPISASGAHEGFIACLSAYTNSSTISTLVYTPSNSSYRSILNATAQNLRFVTPSTPTPEFIVAAVLVSHIQATIICARRYNLQIRSRSGGHDFEGLSYVASTPFIILDMFNFNSISVDLESQTAWVGTGATLGELYNGIAQKSGTLAFPAGLCPSVGVGGHISGGGWGMLVRKYGLAADNVLDVRLVDVKGRILDRKRMGEDLFWAIRGGGAANFGVVVAWNLRLVPVRDTVTVFSLARTSEQNASKLIHQWQLAAPQLPNEIMTVIRTTTENSTTGKITAVAQFFGLFLGPSFRLLQFMDQRLPELGLAMENCREMTWIDSVLYFQNFTGSTIQDLAQSRGSSKTAYKGKSDYVKDPIPETAIAGMLERLVEIGSGVQVVFECFGGIMDEIPSSAIPFPHRAGNIFQILYTVGLTGTSAAAAEERISWIRRLYDYMAPYVSQSPRRAYVNYRDLDVGMNNPVGKTSYAQAKVWGERYFAGNFDRLIHVKTEVDPLNFFHNEQSIPSLAS